MLLVILVCLVGVNLLASAVLAVVSFASPEPE
jgi:hypothetical protein